MFAGLRKMPTFATANAEIAQLVEHNLAKVGVASSSLVFRSQKRGPTNIGPLFYFLQLEKNYFPTGNSQFSFFSNPSPTSMPS